LNKTPFFVLYGQEPRQLGIDVENCEIEDLDQWLKDRSLMQQLLQQHLLRAQKKMKHQADRHQTLCYWGSSLFEVTALRPVFCGSSFIKQIVLSLFWSLQDPIQDWFCGLYTTVTCWFQDSPHIPCISIEEGSTIFTLGMSGIAISF
jgi:hypothetical protein